MKTPPAPEHGSPSGMRSCPILSDDVRPWYVSSTQRHDSASSEKGEALKSSKSVESTILFLIPLRFIAPLVFAAEDAEEGETPGCSHRSAVMHLRFERSLLGIRLWSRFPSEDQERIGECPFDTASRRRTQKVRS
jgi:hypothetical protein